MNFDHKHVVNYSGGVCSFWAAHRVVERFGKDNVVLLFADTKMEDEDLYTFLERSSEYLGVPITVIEDGRTPWQVFNEEDMIGNSFLARCSTVLKQELLDAWRRKNCLEMTTTVYLGLDWSEGHRLERTRLKLPGWKIEAPMQWEPLWDKTRMFGELVKTGIGIPRLYTMGFPHNNCGGFCVKAGQAHFAHLWRMMPHRYLWHELNEQNAREKIGKDVAVLRREVKGVKVPLTLRQLREDILAGKEYDKLEWGGCGCSEDR